MNNVYRNLLNKITEEDEIVEALLNADNVLGLNLKKEDVVNFLEFSSNDKLLPGVLVGDIIITEGDILTTLKLINDLSYCNGKYTLFINDDNLGTNTYLVTRANSIYTELGINVSIEIDYSENYNAYLEKLVNLVGSEDFIETASLDFNSSNKIIV